MRIYGVSDFNREGSLKSRDVFKRVHLTAATFAPSAADATCPIPQHPRKNEATKSVTLAKEIGLKRQSGTSINDLRSVFEKCQLRVSSPIAKFTNTELGFVVYKD